MGVTLAGTGQVLFELKVYRLTEKKYNQDFKKYFEKHKLSNPNIEIEEKLNMNLLENFGGYWQYNQIIGYLEFYILGSDIRCAYYQGFNKKARRNGKRTFIIYDDTLFKVRIKKKYTNEQIIEKIRNIIKDCSIQKMLKRRYVDTVFFDNISSFVDWKSYIQKLKEEKT